MMDIRNYLTQIEKHLSTGQATEHSYRPALKALIESCAKDITAINEPKWIKCGAPDFIVTSGQTPLGHIEAKDIGKSLEDIESDSQLKRYREGLGNLILTDYLEFRWYVDGERRMMARLANVTGRGKLSKSKEGADDFAKLIDEFLSTQAISISTPKELAQRMASLSRLMKVIIVKTVKEEGENGSLYSQLDGFREVLLHDLNQEDFADMYSQTICYGLFAARCNHNGKEAFTREKAAYDLPKTNPFLRKTFGYMAGAELNENLVWIVNDLAELLNRADIEGILTGFGKRTRREDPVVHFYETFLAEYDPKKRKSRGVYYTPEPVVSYIVQSIDHILKKDFGLKDGLADTSKVPIYRTVKDEEGKTRREKIGECHKVLILDPAVGTGTFLHGVIDHIHEHIVNKGQAGTWSNYVSEHLLPRIFGFELLMAPYAVAHMKLDLQLRETGYDFKANERLNIFLTNTLEEAFKTEGLLPFARWIADEANEAGRIKTERPVMVILGNPPYSGHSANKGDWIRKLLRGEDTSTGEKTDNYFEVDGKPLGERNPKWLNDDYVKFIRFAQWRIQKTGYGVLAFISNHGYLDNPTFRGMRQSLMESSDDIYVLDLHGNSKKKEKCPDGSQDENVFDIQQGVAIGIFVKRAGGSATPTRDACQSDSATVRHIHLWGLREVFGKNFHDQKQLTAGKSSWLYENDISTGNWTTIKPQSPSYLFVPRDTKLLEEYQAYWKIGDAMPENNVGFVTARDRFVTDFDRDSLERRIKEFRSEESNISSSELSSKYALKNTSSWNLGTARRLLRADGNWEHHFRMCLYRPFDSRHIYYSRIMLERPVHQIQMIGSGNWDIIFCSSHIVEFNLFRRGGNAMFPLYLYSQREKGDLLDASEPTDTPGGRRPNLSPEFIEEFSKKLGMTFVPDGKGDPGAAGNAAVSAAVLKASRLQNGGRDALHTASETLAVQGDSCNAAVSAAVSGASRPSFGQVEIRDRGRLPHWEIEGGIYFITFRLADSLPQSVLKAIIAEREDILKTARQAGREVSKAERARLAKLTSKKIERYLDSGAGACHLRNDKVAEVVADAIRHFDGKYYRLFAWTVMPNHVHIVVKLLPDHNLQKTLHSCKSFTSHQANLILGRKGIFWSREYYDHLVRDEEEFYRVVRYVANNPKKANLKDWKWCWVDEKWGQDAPNTASGTLALQNGGQDAPNTASETLALPGGRDALETASETLAVQGTFGPEDIFHYIYAVFHSPTYRSRYAEFLKIDFPRVPLTSNQTLFRTLCGLGKELVDLHLMEKHGPDLAGYPVDGSHQVEKVRYSEPGKCSAGGRVWINDAQYFGNVSPEVWEFHIGGYQVCQKWLKDRKGRTLSYDDQTHYQYIVSALSETIRIMSEIDQAIDQHGGWPIR